MSDAKMKAELEAFRKENAKLKEESQKNYTISMKVSEKGGVSIYGLGSRFPVTLYKAQWEKLNEAMPAVMKFIENNAKSLKVKE